MNAVHPVSPGEDGVGSVDGKPGAAKVACPVWRGESRNLHQLMGGIVGRHPTHRQGARLLPYGTCRRVGMDPFAYLRDTFARLPQTPVGRIDDLLPDCWVAAARQIG